MGKPQTLIKAFVDTTIDASLDTALQCCHEFAGTKSGDMSVFQTLELENLKHKLSVLFLNQIKQNS